MFKKVEINSNVLVAHFSNAWSIRKELIEKYQLLEADINLRIDSSKPEHIQFVLFNGKFGADSEQVDGINQKAVALLLSHGGQAAKEEAGMPYYSNSIVTFPVRKLNDLRLSLDLLEKVSSEDYRALNTDVARC